MLNELGRKGLLLDEQSRAATHRQWEASVTKGKGRRKSRPWHARKKCARKYRHAGRGKKEKKITTAPFPFLQSIAMPDNTNSQSPPP